jgi:GTPase Era involved in 16S rRNA processing
MTSDFRRLVHDISELTGAPPPLLLEDDAPVLEESALADQPIYLVGLIGGKDVGKSAMVNALVGQEITPRTSHGPGTETVIAYAHESHERELRALLDAEVPGQYRMVTHAIARLRRQVLLDLPDIDSHYAAHVEVTRRMLRHMLFPIWMQSVEKYADRRPRELLALVATGNDPKNFVFCLNKADQIVEREGSGAADELRRDFASRIARQLAMDEDPRVWMVSAIHADRYDLPELRNLLSDQKSDRAVEASRQLAARRQDVSLAEWVQRQDLNQRLAALERLEQAAEEELASRVGVPLIDITVPRLLDHPAYRLALADELMQQRVARWPIVNVIHVVLGPLVSALRLRLPVQQQLALASADDLVAQHLRAAAGDGSGERVCDSIQSVFATLQQSSPLVSQLYSSRKYWEPLPAESAEADLRRRLASTIERQRSVLRARFASRGLIGAFFAVLLTVGAVLWFPILQPLLEMFLAGAQVRDLALLAVQLIGVTYLFKHVGFLVLYFIVLWMILKWDTQRRVDRHLAAWKANANLDPALSLTGQVVEWNSALLDPIRQARRRMADLVQRTSQLLASLRSGKAA